VKRLSCHKTTDDDLEMKVLSLTDVFGSEQGYIYNKKTMLFSSVPAKFCPEMKPLTSDRRYDNVLVGQGYCTPHGAVTDEHSNGGIIPAG
jgi:hypothetical protein